MGCCQPASSRPFLRSPLHPQGWQRRENRGLVGAAHTGDFWKQPDTVLSQAQQGCCRGQPRSPSQVATKQGSTPGPPSPGAVTCLDRVLEERLPTCVQR